ncbi:glycosyltransferase [Candidatus Saccharibacteria bacterium]|nr:glycosyltransferase [Candidatus Saccharibacteria bacterium]
MKIGIYNPYLDTKGGGEKVCAALAEYFAKDKNNKVFLISHAKINLDELADYFSIDLSRVQFMLIKADNLLLKIVRRLPLPSMAKSFFFDYFHLRALKKQKFDIFINNSVFSNMPSPSAGGVYLCMFPQKLGWSKNISPAKKIYMKLMHGLYRITMHRGAKYGVLTYKKILANSEFTKDHIMRRWGLQSDVLYPICDDMRLKNPPQKEKIILHVGRFFANDGGNHHKRQDMLLEEFSKMDKLHKDSWQLHFAGSVAEDSGALKYIIGLTQKAKGLPVYFHFNCSFPELKDLFNVATIYWHATGYGSNPEKYPQRQEHFGMSTVEAMSTGAIPVVINTAGQKESVTQGKNGFLWSTKKELADYTTRVSSLSPAELKLLQDEAIKSAARFNKSAFIKQVDTIFGEMLG